MFADPDRPASREAVPLTEIRQLFPIPSLRMVRIVSALVVLAGAVLLISPLLMLGAVLPDSVWVHGMTFYGVTVGAYGLLPFVRRGDIAVVAMWLVLGVGVAPCFVGQELSAPHMFADMAGVLMGAAPIYIARFRQVAQGDVRHQRRRLDEVEVRVAPATAGPAAS
jgi:hypothetical protein